MYNIRVIVVVADDDENVVVAADDDDVTDVAVTDVDDAITGTANLKVIPIYTSSVRHEF